MVGKKSKYTLRRFVSSIRGRLKERLKLLLHLTTLYGTSRSGSGREGEVDWIEVPKVKLIVSLKREINVWVWNVESKKIGRVVFANRWHISRDCYKVRDSGLSDRTQSIFSACPYSELNWRMVKITHSSRMLSFHKQHRHIVFKFVKIGLNFGI